ncbi:MAG: hypothetical protein OXG56_12570 [Gammaproteobacteria bacterium]|nr:hypothetical protein [Gammaproteobacteria bacterium]
MMNTSAPYRLLAVHHLVEGRGHEPTPLDIDEVIEHLMVAAARIGQADRALRELRRISGSTRSEGLMADRLERNLTTLRDSGNNGGRCVYP